MTGKDGDLCKRQIMSNIVVDKEIMVHEYQYELQDGPLMEQSFHKDIKSGDFGVNGFMMILITFS